MLKHICILFILSVLFNLALTQDSPPTVDDGDSVLTVDDGDTVSDGISTPSNGISTPSDGISTPSDGISTPSNGISTPSDGISTPSNGISTPSDGISTPSNGDSDDSDENSTPSNGISTPSNGETDDSDEISIPSLPSDNPNVGPNEAAVVIRGTDAGKAINQILALEDDIVNDISIILGIPTSSIRVDSVVRNGNSYTAVVVLSDSFSLSAEDAADELEELERTNDPVLNNTVLQGATIETIVTEDSSRSNGSSRSSGSSSDSSLLLPIGTFVLLGLSLL